jgi:hypothetical protein
MSACLLRNKRSVLLTSYKAGAIALALLCSMVTSQAQNLVPNPSFEEYTICPMNYGYWNSVYPWFDPVTPDTAHPLSAADYFNTCVPYPDNDLCSVPQNVMGYQQPHTGNGYMGFALVVIYGQPTAVQDNYEHISIKLLSKLAAGRKYCVEFYISSPDNINCFADKIGAYFSTDTVITPGFYTNIPVVAQFETPANIFYTDTVSWQKIEGSFIAVGGEQFLTIGSFHPPGEINFLNMAPPPSGCNGHYIFIDDVSVYLCDSTISVNENPVEKINLNPNPSIGTFTVQDTFTKQAQLSVYNAVGSLVYEQQITAGSQNPEINISNFNNGIYLIRVNTPTKILLNERLLIAK